MDGRLQMTWSERELVRRKECILRASAGVPVYTIRLGYVGGPLCAPKNARRDGQVDRRVIRYAAVVHP